MGLYSGNQEIVNGSRIRHSLHGVGTVVSQADTSFIGRAVYVRFDGMSKCQLSYLCFVKDVVVI